LRSIKTCEGIQGDKQFNFWWVRGKGMILFLGWLFNTGNLDILFINILRNGHKNLMFLTLVPWKIFVITIIAKTLELEFNHFCPSQFLYLERSGGIGGSSARNKRGFFVLGRDDMLCFLGSFSSFQPSLWVNR
jgi:hypothetical protein